MLVTLTHLSTPATRSKAVGIYSTIRGLGFGSGPVIGGAVATYYSFNTAFLPVRRIWTYEFHIGQSSCERNTQHLC